MRFRFGTFRSEVAASLRLWSGNIAGTCEACPFPTSFRVARRTFRAFSGKTPSAPASPCLASGRLTRSARRHGDTESGFEICLRTASSTIRLREGRVPSRPNAPTGRTRRAMYPRRPRRVASERIRPAVPCVAGRDALRRVRSHGLPSSHLCRSVSGESVSVEICGKKHPAPPPAG